jgi:hypothetical protein
MIIIINPTHVFLLSVFVEQAKQFLELRCVFDNTSLVTRGRSKVKAQVA